jgi:hypothetical protein
VLSAQTFVALADTFRAMRPGQPADEAELVLAACVAELEAVVLVGLLPRDASEGRVRAAFLGPAGDVASQARGPFAAGLDVVRASIPTIPPNEHRRLALTRRVVELLEELLELFEQIEDVRAAAAVDPEDETLDHADVVRALA